jgi:hypothetical protein
MIACFGDVPHVQAPEAMACSAWAGPLTGTELMAYLQQHQQLQPLRHSHAIEAATGGGSSDQHLVAAVASSGGAAAAAELPGDLPASMQYHLPGHRGSSHSWSGCASQAAAGAAHHSVVDMPQQQNVQRFLKDNLDHFQAQEGAGEGDDVLLCCKRVLQEGAGENAVVL